MKYFSGEPTDLGTVTALPYKTFADLRPWLEKVAIIPHTREAFHALGPKERSIAKRVGYLTPAAFTTSPAPRRTENVERCNLLALDIDDGREAKRMLDQGWGVLAGLGFVAWHTASSTPAHPRIRIIVSADRLAPQRYAPAIKTLAEMLGLVNVTRESLVPVQPMFLPTTFLGDMKSPIIAADFQGHPFTTGDILDPEEITTPIDPEPTDDVVADIAFLAAPLDNITIEDAADALTHLDPDCPMQEWIEIAAGLKHQFQTNDEAAYSIWDAWSAKGKKYVDSDETAARWKSLKGQPVNRAPVTMRSVFRKAVARGWTNSKVADRAFTDTMGWIISPARATEQLRDEGLKRIARVAPVLQPLSRGMLLDAMRKTLKGRNMPVPLQDLKRELRNLEMDEARTTGVPPWARHICFVTALNVFYRPQVDRRFLPEVVDTMYSSPKIGDEQLRARDYLTKVVGIPQVENLRYEPAQGDKRFFNIDSVPFVNTYRSCGLRADPERADEAKALFIGHLVNLIREPELITTLLDYLAFIHQFPGVKIRWAPLIQSTKGAGKGFIGDVLMQTLGRRNVRILNPETVMEGRYNDWAGGAQLVIMNEIRVIGANRHSVMDRMKGPISDTVIGVRRMYEPPQTINNVTNYLLLTNYHDALAVQDDERRYFVIASPLQRASDVAKMGGEGYFNRLYDALHDNPGGFLHLFMNHKISPDFNANGRAPITVHFFDLVENSASPLAAAVRTAINDEPLPLVRKDLVSMQELRRVLTAMNLPPFSDQALAQVLREMTWVKGGRLSLNGERHQLWSSEVLPDIRRMAEERVEVL